jgi:hypothetical protein
MVKRSTASSMGLHSGEFELYFQPKVAIRNLAVIGVEALIRWNHPEHGLLLPGTFLPMIENHALSVDVGEWVIASALGHLTRWDQMGLNLEVSVNVGAYQLQREFFTPGAWVSCWTAHPNTCPRGRAELLRSWKPARWATSITCRASSRNASRAAYPSRWTILVPDIRR